MEILDKTASFRRVETRGDRSAEVLCLSNRLANGALPLEVALDWAADIASALRELHGAGREHGAVAADSVMLGPSGASLRSPRERSDEAGQRGDVGAFGALLYEMVAGRKPGGGIESSLAVARQGPEGLRRSASCLALRCQAPEGSRPNMQQVLTEIRLFRVLARQCETPPEAAPERCLPVARPASTLPAPSGLRCPRCGGFAHFSRARTLFEGLLDVLGIRLQRCLRCHYRYGVVLGIIFSRNPSPR